MWCFARTLLALLLFLSAGLAAPGTEQAVTDKSKPPSDLANFLSAGWRSEREKLVTGKGRITGWHECEGVRLKIDVPFAFDHAKGMRKYRVLWEKEYDGWWLLTPELLAQCGNFGPNSYVEVVKPTHRLLLPFVREFDPRTFGPLLFTDLTSGVTFDQQVRRLMVGLEAVERLDAGRYQVLLVEQSPQVLVRTKMVINEKQGFSVEKTDIQTQLSPKDPWYHATSTATEWQQLNSIWVPVSIASVGRANPGRVPDKVDLRIDWDQVNEPIPAEEFDIQNLGVPPGSKIVDRRQNPDKAVLIGIIGGQLGPEGITASSGGMQRLWVIVMTVGLLLAVCLFVYWVYSKRSKLASSS